MKPSISFYRMNASSSYYNNKSYLENEGFIDEWFKDIDLSELELDGVFIEY